MISVQVRSTRATTIENRARFAIEVATAIAEEIGADVASGLADLEAYSQMLLANPDFVARLQTDAPMNEANHNDLFGGTAQATRITQRCVKRRAPEAPWVLQCSPPKRGPSAGRKSFPT